jgi:hypothetical protein
MRFAQEWSNRNGKILLLGVQLVVAAIACELMYRGYLILTVSGRAHTGQLVLPDVLHVYWPQPFTFRSYGYDYGPPSHIVTQLALTRDEHAPFGYRIARILPSTYDNFGNMPPFYSEHRTNNAYTDVEYEKADLKILTFGSSFTAGTWPDVMQYRLEQKTGLKVRVINFARDFSGVLQMMDVAAYHVPRLRPDISLIAFTTGDLIVPRTWRGVAKWRGYDRVFISTVEDPTPSDLAKDLGLLGDAALVSPLVQGMSGEHASTGTLPRSDDPRLGKLLEQARALAEFGRQRKPRPKIELLDLSRSYILNLLLDGDALAGVELDYPPETGYLPVRIDNFAADERMGAAVRSLGDAGADYDVIHLPRLDQEYSPDRKIVFRHAGARPDQERRLLASLERLTARSVFYVGSKLDGDISYWSDFTQGPGDSHPNRLGANLYAEIIADHVIERLKLPRKPDGPPNAALSNKLAELRASSGTRLERTVADLERYYASATALKTLGDQDGALQKLYDLNKQVEITQLEVLDRDRQGDSRLDLLRARTLFEAGTIHRARGEAATALNRLAQAGGQIVMAARAAPEAQVHALSGEVLDAGTQLTASGDWGELSDPAQADHDLAFLYVHLGPFAGHHPEMLPNLNAIVAPLLARARALDTTPKTHAASYRLLARCVDSHGMVALNDWDPALSKCLHQFVLQIEAAR